MELRTGENDSGRRLDRVLRKALRNHPLPLIYRLLRQGLILVDGKPARAEDRISAGVLISIPSLKDIINSPDPPMHHAPGAVDILWQGHGLIAVNKPAGLATHGPESLDTMVNSYLAGRLPTSLSFRPGPLHRLDKPSSGIVVFSASIEGARNFSSLLRERNVRKTYLALVEGKLEKEEIWQDELTRDKNKKKTFIREKPDSSVSKSAGSCAKTALTRVTPLAVNSDYSLIKATISTGRTHQIRAQASAHGHPLAEDYKYGGKPLELGAHHSGKKSCAGFFLHAWKLELERILIQAPIPPAFTEVITQLFGNNIITDN